MRNEHKNWALTRKPPETPITSKTLLDWTFYNQGAQTLVEGIVVEGKNTENEFSVQNSKALEEIIYDNTGPAL